MNAPTSKSAIRVIKLGGSLLSNPETPERIQRWLNQTEPEAAGKFNPSENYWIVGGGELVNTIRDWDTKYSLDPKLAHWTSIELMNVNSRLLSAWFPQWPVVEPQKPQSDSPKFKNQIVLVNNWMRESDTGLPESWATTSDSIAVALADFLQADELVVLKSCDPPEKLSSKTLADSDFVDQQFDPQIQSLKKRMDIRFVNLNSDCFAEAGYFTKVSNSPLIID